ncbi:MAG: ATPase, T2SS/T4P/T4SS family, partial [Nitrospirota bacterium]
VPQDILKTEDSYDFSFSLNGKRFRANYYKSLGYPKIAIRVLMDEIPEFMSIFSPNVFENLFNIEKGLTIVVGKTSSGKTTAIFSALNLINSKYLKHIITIENPIEYLLEEDRSVISQREIGSDVKGFNIALSQCVRQSPDIIFVGEVRDRESAELSITLAETGHLVITTVHGGSIIEGIEKLISYYESGDEKRARALLSGVFNGALYVKIVDGNIDYEYLFATEAVKSLIREGKTYQLNSEIERQNLWKR